MLSSLKAELREPAVLAEYVRAYHGERKRLAQKAAQDRSRIERRGGEIKRAIKRHLDAFGKGEVEIEVIDDTLIALEAEQNELQRRLAPAPEPPKEIALHSTALARYERQLERLQDALNDGIRAGDTEATATLRDLIDTVTVRRDPSRWGGVEVAIAGRLTGLLGEKAFPNKVKGVWGRMVAEEGLEPPTHGL